MVDMGCRWKLQDSDLPTEEVVFGAAARGDPVCPPAHLRPVRSRSGGPPWRWAGRTEAADLALVLSPAVTDGCVANTAEEFGGPGGSGGARRPGARSAFVDD